MSDETNVPEILQTVLREHLTAELRVIMHACYMIGLRDANHAYRLLTQEGLEAMHAERCDEIDDGARQSASGILADIKRVYAPKPEEQKP